MTRWKPTFRHISFHIHTTRLAGGSKSKISGTCINYGPTMVHPSKLDRAKILYSLPGPFALHLGHSAIIYDLFDSLHSYMKVKGIMYDIFG